MEKRTGKIALISAVPFEGEFFIKRLDRTAKDTRDHPAFYAGKIQDHDIIYAVSGVGKTNAAHATTLLIHEYAPAMIINFGVGGAYPSAGLKAGDIAVASKEIYADEGVLLKDGFHTLETIGLHLLKTGRRKYFNEFPADRKLGKAALNSATLITSSKSGIFATVSSCTGAREKAEELSLKYNAICENMEGAAVAHLCCSYGIPFVEIRGISNIVEDRDTGRWDTKLASENCQKALIEFLKTLNGPR
ncbi:MAG: futalosine hydrolase [Nitrospirota bacterium]|nr:futalosine hydrolase [Nitrospirota bacterium]